jgi:hypothetical protein
MERRFRKLIKIVEQTSADELENVIYICFCFGHNKFLILLLGKHGIIKSFVMFVRV